MSTGEASHTASRAIEASPTAIYAAFVDPAALVQWLPPAGAVGAIEVFEPLPGGRFRMTLTFSSAVGKTSHDTDVVEGRFLELVPAERIVQAISFVSDDAAFGGAMTMTWTFTEAPGGACVTVLAENVPPGISRADHERGMASTLANLAGFLE